MPKINTKKIIGIIALFCFLPSVSHSQETKSDDYQLDFDILVNEAEYTESDNFKVQGHSTEIESVITSESFQIMPPYLPVCGNHIKESGEECDGSDLAGKSCADFGFASGTLSCNLCKFSIAACSDVTGGAGGSLLAYCGDGKINRTSEECDDGNRTDGDGCSKNCELENAISPDSGVLPAHAEPDGETDTPQTETPTEPTQENENLHSAAPETTITTKPTAKPSSSTKPNIPAQKENLHPAPQNSEPVRTLDQTPILFDTLEPNTTYEIKIYNSQNEEIKFEDENQKIEKLIIETNEEGNFVYQIPESLGYDNYTFEIINPENQEKNYQNLTIVDEDYAEIKIEKINTNEVENDYEKDIHVQKGIKNILNGTAEKNSKIVVYLPRSAQKIEIAQDENGKFEYEIPENEDQIYVLQIYADGTISKNLGFVLNPDSGNWDWIYWLAAVALLSTILIIYKKKKQK